METETETEMEKSPGKRKGGNFMTTNEMSFKNVEEIYKREHFEIHAFDLNNSNFPTLHNHKKIRGEHMISSSPFDQQLVSLNEDNRGCMGLCEENL